MIQTFAALTLKEPVLFELRLPGESVEHGVDVADAGDAGLAQLLLRHHTDLAPLEDDGAVWRARMIKFARQQVETNTKWF